jgi:predicted amidophosphoribosyltransferase
MRALLDLVLPMACAGCGGVSGPACPGCLGLLAGPARWTRPRPAPAGLPAVSTAAAYAGPVRNLLIAYKEHAASGLARPLGEALARAVAFGASGGRDVVMVPVPSAASQCRRRGGDVVADVAAVARRRLRAEGRPVAVVRALRHVRDVADSAGLDARARAANAAGALGLRRGAAVQLAGRTVVVVDDLVTTGVSLVEATRVLQAAGAVVVCGATVAATSRRSQADAPASYTDRLHKPAAGHYGGGEDSRRLEEALAWTSS